MSREIYFRSNKVLLVIIYMASLDLPSKLGI